MSIEEIKKELLSSAVERKRTGHLQPSVTDCPLPNLHKASLLSEEAAAATIYPVILNSQEDSSSFKPIDCFEDDIVGQSPHPRNLRRQTLRLARFLAVT
jgi:hypothetical protein